MGLGFNSTANYRPFSFPLPINRRIRNEARSSAP
jgi:hypothetical protein